MFDTIRYIFERHSELIGGTADRQENARKIMTQIVNLLTSKLEIGAPLASLYLLQNPDHYTDHKFVSFYWISYVHEARKVWHNDDAMQVEENKRLVMQRSKNDILGVSAIFDYIYHPFECGSLCLYDWICTYQQHSYSQKQQAKKQKSVETNNSVLLFKNDHPLYNTHGVQALSSKFQWVPNFIGPSLPHSDKGDREFYCATMLCLFKPWHTGYDLKAHNHNWDLEFAFFNFKAGHKLIMQNMNVKYECMDAHDDHSLQCCKLANELGFVHSSGFKLPDKFVENIEDTDDYDLDIENDSFLTNIVGCKSAKWEYDKAIVEEIMTNSGWLKDLSDDNSYIVVPEEIHPTICLDAAQWRARVLERKNAVITELKQNTQSHTSSLTSSCSMNTNALNQSADIQPYVKIIDQSYLLKSYHTRSIELGNLLEEIENQFQLNNEQK